LDCLDDSAAPHPTNSGGTDLDRNSWHRHRHRYASVASSPCRNHRPDSEKPCKHRRPLLCPSWPIKHGCTATSLGCNGTGPRPLDSDLHPPRTHPRAIFLKSE